MPHSRSLSAWSIGSADPNGQSWQGMAPQHPMLPPMPGKWSWIDGILLGGCLAYALGDYQKAQDWYKHILTLDKE